MTKYILDGDTENIVDAVNLEEAVEIFLNQKHKPITESEMEEKFNEVLDCEGEHTIPNVGTYSISYLMQELDPIAYRCSLTDYMSGDFVEVNGDYYNSDDYDEVFNGTEEYSGNIIN